MDVTEREARAAHSPSQGNAQCTMHNDRVDVKCHPFSRLTLPAASGVCGSNLLLLGTALPMRLRLKEPACMDRGSGENRASLSLLFLSPTVDVATLQGRRSLTSRMCCSTRSRNRQLPKCMLYGRCDDCAQSCEWDVLAKNQRGSVRGGD